MGKILTKDEYLEEQAAYWENHAQYHPANAFCGSAGPEEEKHLHWLLSKLSDQQLIRLASSAGLADPKEADRGFCESVLDEIDKEDFYRLYHQVLES
jgi:hypothetical protein